MWIKIMNKIELVFNKSYVVVDCRNNQIIHFTNNIKKNNNLKTKTKLWKKKFLPLWQQ